MQIYNPVSLPQGTITSKDEPIDKNNIIWNELNSDDNLVESWINIKNRWISLTKYSFDYWTPTSSIAGNVSYIIPIDFRYDYLFREYLYYCLYSTGTVNATTDYWRAIATTQPSGITFANSQAILNDNLSKLISLNTIFSPQPGERLLMMYNKFGNAPSARIATSLRYHLLRK